MTPDSQSGSPKRPRAGDSILDSIARRTGRAPQVNLRDAGTSDAAPIIDPKAHSVQDELSKEDQGKYRILGELARGGMGVVVRGHDLELGREVAIKISDPELAQRPEVIERFVEEAQIGGQLQHPGIVPVYELGLMADQRPFFTMKLIKGRTLAAMLTRRKSNEEDRARFLGILESVCQTMAYAHSKGVIHRDLKPANIMVGAFGEVQVVDWGLSKVLRHGGVDDEIEARDTALSVIETVRSGPGSGTDSIVGNVLGTPAYMSPEQAQGEIAKLDERTDVFALGAILCEILTGAPPYLADKGENIVQKAALAELDDARARIEACNADEELKKLCLSAMLPARAARPRDADELAKAVHAYLAGLEDRAQKAQLEAAEERLQAARSRGRFQVTALALTLVVAALGVWLFLEGQRERRQEELLAQVQTLEEEVFEHQRSGRLAEAVQSAKTGLLLVESEAAGSGLAAKVERLIAAAEGELAAEEARTAQLERERTLFDFLADVESRQGIRAAYSSTDAELNSQYAAAFERFGLDLEAEDLGEQLTAMRDTDLGIRLAQGFDNWANLLRRMNQRANPEALLGTDLSDAAYALRRVAGFGLDLDTHPVRSELRLALIERDDERVLALADELDLETAEPNTLMLMSSSLADSGQFDRARALVMRGADRFPQHFGLNYRAGYSLYVTRRFSKADHYREALAYTRTAMVLRPDVVSPYTLLTDIYYAHGDYVRAYHTAVKLIELAPDYGWSPAIVGIRALLAGKPGLALEEFEGDLELDEPHEMSGVMAQYCRFLLDEISLEAMVDWALANDEAEDAGYTLVFTGTRRVVPRPGRALEVLEPLLPNGVPEPDYWDALAWAYLLVGDEEAALMAFERLKQYKGKYSNQASMAMDLLFQAILARRSGDDLMADWHLSRARWLREELTIGMEEEWESAPFTADFERFEELAAGG